MDRQAQVDYRDLSLRRSIRDDWHKQLRDFNHPFHDEHSRASRTPTKSMQPTAPSVTSMLRARLPATRMARPSSAADL